MYDNDNALFNNALFNRSVDHYQLIQVTSTQVVSIV